jgi:hypothetical protein
MGQVIHIDFSKKDHESGLTIYLNYLRAIGLDEDDVLDVQDAVLDVDHYLDADEVIQKFANDWFSKFE